MSLPNITTVRCLKGSHHHGLVKNRVYPVTKVKENDDHTVSVTVQLTDRPKTFQVRHRNRLSDTTGFNGHTGDPTKTVRLINHTGE